MPGQKSLRPRAARRPQGTDATPLDHLTAAAAVDAPPRPSDPRTRSRGRDTTARATEAEVANSLFEALAATGKLDWGRLSVEKPDLVPSREDLERFDSAARRLGVDVTMVAEQYPQIGHVSSLYGLFQFNHHLMCRGALRHDSPLLLITFARRKKSWMYGKNPF